MLDNPLGNCQPRKDSYNNDDFFAYVGKRYGGGTVSDQWTGVIRGYTWSVVDDKMIISFGDGYGMEATLSEDCDAMLDGVFTPDANTCWTAEKW